MSYESYQYPYQQPFDLSQMQQGGGQQPFDIGGLLGMLPQAATAMNPLAMLGMQAGGAVLSGLGNALFPSKMQKLQEESMQQHVSNQALIANRVGQTEIDPQQYTASMIQSILPDLRQQADRAQEQLGIGSGQGFQHILGQLLADFNAQSLKANQSAKMFNAQADLRKLSLLA